MHFPSASRARISSTLRSARRASPAIAPLTVYVGTSPCLRIRLSVARSIRRQRRGRALLQSSRALFRLANAAAARAVHSVKQLFFRPSQIRAVRGVILALNPSPSPSATVKCGSETSMCRHFKSSHANLTRLPGPRAAKHRPQIEPDVSVVQQETNCPAPSCQTSKREARKVSNDVGPSAAPRAPESPLRSSTNCTHARVWKTVHPRSCRQLPVRRLAVNLVQLHRSPIAYHSHYEQ